MQENIGKQIVRRIKKCGRGTIFFPSSFPAYGDIKSVSRSLEQLTNDAVIVRLANGIYLYPKINKELGLGGIIPIWGRHCLAGSKKRPCTHCSDRCLCLEPSRTIYSGTYERGLPDRRFTKKD